jgi:hypothetical protein
MFPWQLLPPQLVGFGVEVCLGLLIFKSSTFERIASEFQ